MDVQPVGVLAMVRAGFPSGAMGLLVIVLGLLAVRAAVGVLRRAHIAKTVAAIWINVPTEEEAVRIGNAMLAEGLAAAANITSPVRSLYRWQGRMEDRSEVVLILKTVYGLSARVSRRAAELHSYQVPSILVFPASPPSHTPYKLWVRQETGSLPWWKTLRMGDIAPTGPGWSA